MSEERSQEMVDRKVETLLKLKAAFGEKYKTRLQHISHSMEFLFGDYITDLIEAPDENGHEIGNSYDFLMAVNSLTWRKGSEFPDATITDRADALLSLLIALDSHPVIVSAVTRFLVKSEMADTHDRDRAWRV